MESIGNRIKGCSLFLLLPLFQRLRQKSFRQFLTKKQLVMKTISHHHHHPIYPSIKSFFPIKISGYYLSSRSTIKQKKYKMPTGILYSIGDSTITLSKDYTIPSTTQKEFHIHQIEGINVRKKGKLGKNIAIGGALGGVLGAIVGFSLGDGKQCTRYETRTSTSIPLFFW